MFACVVQPGSWIFTNVVQPGSWMFANVSQPGSWTFANVVQLGSRIFAQSTDATPGYSTAVGADFTHNPSRRRTKFSRFTMLGGSRVCSEGGPVEFDQETRALLTHKPLGAWISVWPFHLQVGLEMARHLSLRVKQPDT